MALRKVLEKPKTAVVSSPSRVVRLCVVEMAWKARCTMAWPSIIMSRGLSRFRGGLSIVP